MAIIKRIFLSLLFMGSLQNSFADILDLYMSAILPTITQQKNATVDSIELNGTNISNGLIAHYKFDGDVNDSSGNENHGTVSGLASYVAGADNTAIHLDGNRSSITLGDALIPTGQYDDMSISMFIKPADINNSIEGSGIISQYTAGPAGRFLFRR